MNRVEQLKRRLDQKKLKYKTAIQVGKKAKAAVADAKERKELAIEAQVFITEVAETIQKQAHAQIADVVSRCLKAVFDDPYEFEIKFCQKRGRTEANLVFVRDGLEAHPMSATGGGAVDVAAFALRVACLILSRPHLRRTIILDEPFKFVSYQYRERVRDMLQSLSDDLDIQFIMVTHIEELVIGKVVHI